MTRQLAVCVLLVAGCGIDPGDVGQDPASNVQSDVSDCAQCTNPDAPGCAACILGTDADAGPGALVAQDSPFQDPSVVDVIRRTETTLDFAIVGDTRPPAVDDLKQYPTAVITKIWQDVQAASPRPTFAVGTGDYQFSRSTGGTAASQLALYVKARSAYGGTEYPAMGNHECTGMTASNCGPGTTNGATGLYNLFLKTFLTPLVIHNPYYTVLVTAADHSWTAKFVFIAANAWTSTQATWLDAALTTLTTYTFVVRHESSKANTAPGVTPSGTIIAKHPYTMLIVGHEHAYKHLSQKEIIVGNGGAPLTTGANYGYGLVTRRSDGAIVFSFHDYATNKVQDTFVVKADGSPTR